jgi:polyisoprenoid-binding protein YceI
MKVFLPVVFAFILIDSSIAQKFFNDAGTAIFTSKVPLHTFKGTSENLTGLINLEDQTVDFYLDLETLETGNAKRDKDMLITLETDVYPFAEFYGSLSSPFDLSNRNTQNVTVNGVFTMHGISKEVQISGSLQPVSDGLLLTANWVLNLAEYNIKPPRLLILKVDDNQEIEINILLKPYTEDEK